MKSWTLTIGLLLAILLGCNAHVRPPQDSRSTFCDAPTESNALSYRYEACLRQRLVNADIGEIRKQHDELSDITKLYLTRRLNLLQGKKRRSDACQTEMPEVYCNLLAARSLEDRGAAVDAHSIYDELSKNRYFRSVSLAGLVRTEPTSEPSTNITPSSHPDAEAALCKRALTVAKVQTFAHTLSSCSPSARRSSEVISILADREWSFGLKEKAIERLEAQVDRMALDHRNRRLLSRFLFIANAPRSAVDHVRVLISYRAASALDYKRVVSALIAVEEWRGAERALAALKAEFPGFDSAGLALKLRASVGDRKATIAIVEQMLLEDQELGVVFKIVDTLSGTKLEHLADDILLSALKDQESNPRIWLALLQQLDRAGAEGLHKRLLDGLIERFPNHAPFLFLKAEAYKAQNRYEFAAAALSQAILNDPENLTYRTLEIELAYRTGRFAAAAHLLTKLTAEYPNEFPLAKRLSLVQLLSGDLESARSGLEWMTILQPNDPDLRLQYATILLRMDQPEMALVELKNTIEIVPNYDDAWALIAITYGELARINEAREAFDRALELQPTHQQLRRAYAGFLEAQGDYAGAIEQFEAILTRKPTDEAAQSELNRLLIVTAQESKDDFWYRALDTYGKIDASRYRTFAVNPAPAFVLTDHRYVTLSATGDLAVELRRDVLVTNAEGAEKYKTVSLPYDAHFPPEIVKSQLILPSGEVRDLTPMKWSSINPNRYSPMYGDARSLAFTFEALEPGSILSYVVKTKLPNKPKSMVWWDSYVLGNEVFTASAKYSLSTPKGLDYYIKGKGLTPPKTTEIGDKIVREWIIEDVPAFEDIAASEGTVPMVYVTSFQHWHEVDTWYHGLFAPSTKLGDTLKAEVDKIAEFAKTPEAKVAAVIRLIETDVVYEGIEFGAGAYLPRPAESSWVRRAGDCKDMVGILVGMLRALNISAYPVLVRPRDSGPFVPYYPSPSQFSHVIGLIKLPEGREIWVDPTAKLGTINALPGLVRRASAFIVNGQGGEIVEVPSALEDTFEVSQHTLIEVDTEKSLRSAATTIKLDGDAAGWARMYVSQLRKERNDRHLYMPGLLLGAHNIPASTEVRGLGDPDSVFSISASGQIPTVLSDQQHQIFLGLLDPTHSSLVALLNNAEQVESPTQFTKKTHIEFDHPHELLTPLGSAEINGPLRLKVITDGNGQNFEVTVSLNIDHDQMFKLNEGKFMQLLQHAQMIMEAPMEFRRLP